MERKTMDNLLKGITFKKIKNWICDNAIEIKVIK
jgi:hypothetical protein